MSVSRRRFLKSGALGGLAAGFMFKSNSFALGQDLKYSSDHPSGFDYSRAAFRPLIGSTFRLLEGTQTLDLILVNLTDYQRLARPSRISKAKSTESFVLSFQAPQDLSRSATYQLEHPTLGTFDLFISGNGRGENLTAVVNRLV